MPDDTCVNDLQIYENKLKLIQVYIYERAFGISEIYIRFVGQLSLSDEYCICTYGISRRWSRACDA